jgi:hypothetical protein
MRASEDVIPPAEAISEVGLCKCGFCGEQFQDFFALFQHQDEAHNGMRWPPPS